MAMNQFLLPDLLAQLAMPAAQGREGQAGAPAPGGTAFDTVIDALSPSGAPALAPAPRAPTNSRETAGGRFAAMTAPLQTGASPQWPPLTRISPAIASAPGPAPGDSAPPEGRGTGAALPARAPLTERSLACAPCGQAREAPPFAATVPSAATAPADTAALSTIKSVPPVPRQSPPPCASGETRRDIVSATERPRPEDTATPDLPQPARPTAVAHIPAAGRTNAPSAAALGTTQPPSEIRPQERPSEDLPPGDAATASPPPASQREVQGERQERSVPTARAPAPPPRTAGPALPPATAPLSTAARPAGGLTGIEPAPDDDALARLPLGSAGPERDAAVPEPEPARPGDLARVPAATPIPGAHDAAATERTRAHAAAPSATRHPDDIPLPPAAAAAPDTDAGTGGVEAGTAAPTGPERRRVTSKEASAPHLPRATEPDAPLPAPGAAASGLVAPQPPAAGPVRSAGEADTATAARPPRGFQSAAPGRRPALPDWSIAPSAFPRPAAAPMQPPAGAFRLGEGAGAPWPEAERPTTTSAPSPRPAEQAANRPTVRADVSASAGAADAEPSAPRGAPPPFAASAADGHAGARAAADRTAMAATARALPPILTPRTTRAEATADHAVKPQAAPAEDGPAAPSTAAAPGVSEPAPPAFATAAAALARGQLTAPPSPEPVAGAARPGMAPRGQAAPEFTLPDPDTTPPSPETAPAAAVPLPSTSATDHGAGLENAAPSSVHARQMPPARGGAGATEPAPAPTTRPRVTPLHEDGPASAPRAAQPTASERMATAAAAVAPAPASSRTATAVAELAEGAAPGGVRNGTAAPVGAVPPAHRPPDAGVSSDAAAPETGAAPARTAVPPAGDASRDTAPISAHPPASPSLARPRDTEGAALPAAREAAPGARSTTPLTAGAAGAPLAPAEPQEALPAGAGWPDRPSSAGARVRAATDAPAAPGRTADGARDGAAPPLPSDRHPARASAPAMPLRSGPAKAPDASTAPPSEVTTGAPISAPPPGAQPGTDAAPGRAPMSPDRPTASVDSAPAAPPPATGGERAGTSPAEPRPDRAAPPPRAAAADIAAPHSGPPQTVASRRLPEPMAAAPMPADAAPRPPAGPDGDEVDAAGPIGMAPPAATPDSSPVPTPAAAARDIGHVPAHHVLRQLHEAVAQRPEGPVEVALSPEELGRVRMTLHPAEHGIAVTVQAERPETLDLMRRNIEMLARDFRALGYADVSFSFGAESGERQGGEATPPPFVAEPESASPAPPIAPPTPAARGADGSLDLRM